VDGLVACFLDSTKWKLERGKAYEVTLLAGFAIGFKQRRWPKPKSVDDRSVGPGPLNAERMRTANILEVKRRRKRR